MVEQNKSGENVENITRWIQNIFIYLVVKECIHRFTKIFRPNVCECAQRERDRTLIDASIIISEGMMDHQSEYNIIYYT